MKRIGWIVLGVTALIVTVHSCAERQGSSGGTGGTGQSAISTSSSQSSLTVSIVGASISGNGRPVVRFTVTDQDGLAYNKLTLGTTTDANVRATVAKLVTSTSGDPTYWQTYLNKTETKTDGDPGYWPSGVTTRTTNQGATEGTTEFPAGSLSYEASTGIYTYTFAKNIKSISTPLAVTYSASATHRIGLELRNQTDAEDEALGADATYDFVPAGGTPSSHEVVSTSTCTNACHGKLAAHSETRFTVGYCVMCHNPNTADANSGNVLDFTALAHRLHVGKLLPSVYDSFSALPYRIWGEDDEEFNFSRSTFPVMTASRSTGTDPLNLGNDTTNTTPAGGGSFFPDCVKCHTEGSGAPAQAANWKNRVAQQTCASCHDNIVFDGTGAGAGGFTKNHSGGVQANNSGCSGCHASPVSGTTDAPIEDAHNYAQLVRAGADRWAFAVTSVNYNTGTGALTVVYRVDLDGVQGVNYTSSGAAATLAELTGGKPCCASPSLNFKVAWPAVDHMNNGQTSSTPASAVSTSLTSGVTFDGGSCPGLTCTYRKNITLPFAAVAGQGGTVAVFFDGHPVELIDSGVNNAATPRWRYALAGSDVYYFDVSSTCTGCTQLTEAGDVRRTAADSAKCNNCHSTISLHGGNRSDNVQVCVTCHNASNTDKSKRATQLGGETNLGLDGKLEETIDMKVMIHAIHAGGKSSYADGNTYKGFREHGILVHGNSAPPADFTPVKFPNRLSNCTVCHIPDTYILPLSINVQPTTVNVSDTNTATTGNASTGRNGPVDDRNMSPTAAVCSACHDSTVAKGHMIALGGAVLAVGTTPSGAPTSPGTSGITDADYDSAQTNLTQGFETCAVCHGPGTVADVKKVHRVQ